IWRKGIRFKTVKGIVYGPQVDPELERKHRHRFAKMINYTPTEFDAIRGDAHVRWMIEDGLA
ncbi:unnamed protein product, partial [Amoebophrya sp. A25]